MQYTIIKDKTSLVEYIEVLRNQSEFVYDTETNSLDTHGKESEIVGLGFCFKEGEATYIPFNGDISYSDIVNAIAPVFQDESIKKIGHNIKFDSRALHRAGINIKNIYFDTMVAAYCLYGDRIASNLDDLTLHHLNHIKIRTKTLIPKKNKANPNPNMKQAAIDAVGIYCCEDVDYTFRLYKLFKDMLELPDNAYCKKLFYSIDMPLVEVLVKMECDGVKISETRLDEIKNQVSDKLSKLQQEIDTIAGRPVVLTKPADISNLLYNELKLNEKYDLELVLTESGQASTGAATLEKYKEETIVDKILEYKLLGKLMSTYITAIPEYISRHTGLLHPFFGQTATSTGRLNSSNPNCYDNRTEVLTENGWKLFKDLNNERIAQYVPSNNSISFVNYTNYIEKESDFIYEINSKLGHIDLAVTEEHRILLKTKKDKFFDATPLTYSQDNLIISAGLLNNCLKTGINYDLIFAIQADGSLTNTGVDFSFTKQRKIDRFEKSIGPLKQYADRKRTILKYDSIPNYVWEYIDKNTKKFTNKLIELACPQVIDYLMAWDGVNDRQDMWLSKHKSDIDIVQALLTCSGYRTLLGTYTTQGRTYPLLRITHKNYTYTTNSKVNKKEYKDKVYCVSVPSSYIIVRRGRSVCVSGNCQNIPARTKIGKQLREVFVSRFEGGKILAVDYSQAELRILAHMSKESIFIRAYTEEKDIHTMVASEVVFEKDAASITVDERAKVKTVNFGL